MTLTGIGKPGVTEDKSILVQDLKIIFLVLILFILISVTLHWLLGETVYLQLFDLGAKYFKFFVRHLGEHLGKFKEN